jgi:hypothetical protein
VQQDRLATRIDRATGPGPRGLRAAGWAVPPGWPAGDQFFDRSPRRGGNVRGNRCSLGAILLDICLDLGIAPAQMDRATWDELHLAITLYGGDPAPPSPAVWTPPIPSAGLDWSGKV